MEKRSIWLLLYLTCSLPACCRSFTCFEGTVCSGDSITGVVTKRDCCAGQGLSFRDDEGQCFDCIMFGWIEGTSITLNESSAIQMLQVGFIKGGAVQRFVTDQSSASFEIEIEGRGAVPGVNGDFQVQDTMHSLFGQNPSPFTVPVIVRLDGIALEPAEEFALRLKPTNPTAMEILAAGTPGLIALPEISVVIQDFENVSLQFTEIRYSHVESKRFIRPQLQLSTSIATDLIVDIVPLNLTYARNRMLLPKSLDPILMDPNFNPNTQTATSIADFSITPVQVSFTSANSPETIESKMEIIDDTIHEADQIFVLTLEVISDVDQSRIVPRRTDGLTTLGRIFDDDRISIGFEQEQYTVFERFNATGDHISIPVIKGNNLQSELQFDVIAQFIDGTAVRFTDTVVGDYFANSRISVSFLPGQQFIVFGFVLAQDKLPEEAEVFSIELTSFEAPRVVIGQEGGPFSRATVVIIDDDELTIGWERNLTTVNENHGSLELCLILRNVTEYDILSGFSVILSIGTIRGTAADPADYSKLRTDSNFVFITDMNRRGCIIVLIHDDTLLEEVEFFSIQVVPGPDGLSDKLRLDPDLTFVEILDDDFVRIGFDQTMYTVTEEVGGVATVYVAVLKGALQRPVSVTFSTEVLSSDTATSDVDFDSLTRVLVFDENTLVVPVDITITDDVFDESLETFTVSLVRDPHDTFNEVIIDPDIATISIHEHLMIGFLETRYTAKEEDGTVNLLVGIITGVVTEDIVIRFSTEDGAAIQPMDYLPVDTLLTFSPTVSSISVPITIINDFIDEPLEEFEAKLIAISTVTMAPALAKVFIKDNDVKVADLNMSRPGEQCPDGLTLITSPRRLCRKSTAALSCDSVIYSTNNTQYKTVCGKVIGLGERTTDAFFRRCTGLCETIEGPYVDGVSITHGSPRKHIWSFAVEHPYPNVFRCPCNDGSSHTTPPPSFVGDDYTCETFTPMEPVWDGQGCVEEERPCCDRASVPVFCKELPEPTTDDIEVRLCIDQFERDETVAVEIIELYIQ